MNKKFTPLFSVLIIAILTISFRNSDNAETYRSVYTTSLNNYEIEQRALLDIISKSDLEDTSAISRIKQHINLARLALKRADFWLRYLEPTTYKQLNGPLPVEWETEVFEKFEKPYKREGAGLTLAFLYLDEEHPSKDSLKALINAALSATAAYSADSITKELNTFHHFFLCNRLYLLNLAAIYTTGFECPDVSQVIPELRDMMASVNNIYKAFNEDYTTTPLTKPYLDLYAAAVKFTLTQPVKPSKFDHYSFIKDYINPLYTINQQMINEYHVVSHNMIDYSLNKKANSIFSKDVYNGQNAKGIFLRVTDTAALAEIDRLGKLLFYDPILSGNNLRSCASCHKPAEYFTDTNTATALHYDHNNHLPRNTPTLLNAEYNHLVMLDGKHISLQNQTKGVITSNAEMGGDEKEILKKILSCKEYKEGFTRLLKYTPQEKEVCFEHISAAITYYYCKFSNGSSPFDEAMNNHAALSTEAKEGFNIFMSKAQCATCHFVPQFNGVKPPYIGSEFEVLGVPQDTAYKHLSPDQGRYNVNPAIETLNAFRTGTVRNAMYTKPYMHNGVFTTMEQVIEFYNTGGGAGKGLLVSNQTLSSDSLHLTQPEKNKLVAFIGSLNEKINFEKAPDKLPASAIKVLNNRKVGGAY